MFCFTIFSRNDSIILITCNLAIPFSMEQPEYIAEKSTVLEFTDKHRTVLFTLENAAPQYHPQSITVPLKLSRKVCL